MRDGLQALVFSNPLDGLLLGADLTVVDARFVQSDNPIPLAPWLTSGAHAIWVHGSGWRGGLRLFALAPRPLPHGAQGATMARVDATAGYHWRWLRIDLEVENLFNQQLREGEYHYASHWQSAAAPSNIPVLHYAAAPPLNARVTVAAVF